MFSVIFALVLLTTMIIWHKELVRSESKRTSSRDGSNNMIPVPVRIKECPPANTRCNVSVYFRGNRRTE